MYILFVFVCTPVHAYGHFDRCWTVIARDFNVYLAALPTGESHKLMAGCNRKVMEAWNKRQCIGTDTQNHDKGRCGETVTGVHRSVMGMQTKLLTEGMEKRVGTEV